MHLPRLLHARAFHLAALAPLAAFAILLGAEGCGQDVASCSSVCPAGSSGDCETSCTNQETQCGVANASGDFQALLTCIGNASGSYTSVPPLCQGELDTVNTNCAVTEGFSG